MRGRKQTGQMLYDREGLDVNANTVHLFLEDERETSS